MADGFSKAPTQSYRRMQPGWAGLRFPPVHFHPPCSALAAAGPWPGVTRVVEGFGVGPANSIYHVGTFSGFLQTGALQQVLPEG